MDDIKKLIADSVADMHAAAKRLEESEMFALPKHEAAAIYRSIANSVDAVSRHIEATAAEMKTKIEQIAADLDLIKRQIPVDAPPAPVVPAHIANIDGEAKAEIARYTIERVKEIIS